MFECRLGSVLGIRCNHLRSKYKSPRSPWVPHRQYLCREVLRKSVSLHIRRQITLHTFLIVNNIPSAQEETFDHLLPADKYTCANVCCKEKTKDEPASEHVDHVVPLDTDLILDDLDKDNDDDTHVRTARQDRPRKKPGQSNSLESSREDERELTSRTGLREAKSAGGYGGGGGKNICISPCCMQ